MSLKIVTNIDHIRLMNYPDSWGNFNNTFRLGLSQHMPAKLWIPRPSETLHGCWTLTRTYFDRSTSEELRAYRNYLVSMRAHLRNGSAITEFYLTADFGTLISSIHEFTDKMDTDTSLLSAMLWMKIMYPLLGEAQARALSEPLDIRSDIAKWGYSQIVKVVFDYFINPDTVLYFVPPIGNLDIATYCKKKFVLRPFINDAILYNDKWKSRNISKTFIEGVV